MLFANFQKEYIIPVLQYNSNPRTLDYLHQLVVRLDLPSYGTA